uniref:CoA transferase n=1 Tax=Pelomonas sp. KK5 TaxID=1855730 RepID=UPI00097C2B8D
MSDDAVLAGLRVIEVAKDVAGWSASLHLCEAGAEVLSIDPSRYRSPRLSEAQFEVLGRGKRRLALDLDTEPGRAQLHELLASADVLIHDLPPSAAQRAGLDDEALAATFPALIVSAIGAWPQSHAWADTPVRETLVLAALGGLDEQPGHRPGPIYIRMPFANWIAGWLSAIAVMSRLIARRRDGGRGGAAHTSLAQAALVPMTMHWSRAARPTPVFAKGLDKSTPIPLHRCADGRWIHVHYSPDKAPWMAEALAAMGPEAVAAANAKFPPSHVAPNFGANRAIIATRNADDWARHFWQHDVAAQVAVPFGEIYADEQARLNGYVLERDGRRQPGLAYHLERAPGPAQAQAGTGRAGRAPLSGLKVLDLGAYLAGPFACMLLADLGAEVIKVEPPSGDAMRRLERIFAGTQRGKRGLALKLGDPASAAALESLVKWADVVHHNIRMPAARKLGIAPEQLAALHPGVICGHISSYGPRGPRADWPGFDQLMQAACGWEVENGGAGQPPMWLRFGVGDH